MSGPAGTLKIRDPGPVTTVQDAGRLTARRWGVPVAGTLVPDWLFLANALVGNGEEAAGLEFWLTGPRFTVETDAVLLAVGGPAEMKVEGAEGARSVPPWTATRAERGDKVGVGRVGSGTTAVLAVSGGIDTRPVLGSRATYTRAALGGLDGRALRPGDDLPLGTQGSAEPLALSDPPIDQDDPIRVVLGPQDDHFQPEALEAFLNGQYTVTDMVDRMGMRLDGPALAHRVPELAQIASDGSVPGAVQVPGNGQPIVLLADAQTVGGYPKIATVISADLPRLARLAPGEMVRFVAVGVSEAEEHYRRKIASLRALMKQAKPTWLASGLDLRCLYAANLISGMVDMTRPDHFPGNVS